MNPEQTKSVVRWFVSTFGGVVAGFIAGKGWATAEQVMGVLTSDTFMQVAGALITLGAGVWGLVVHKQANAVAVVEAMPEVRGIVTAPTVEGRALAAAVPSSVVVPAGTPAAAAIADVRTTRMAS